MRILTSLLLLRRIVTPATTNRCIIISNGLPTAAFKAVQSMSPLGLGGLGALTLGLKLLAMMRKSGRHDLPTRTFGNAASKLLNHNQLQKLVSSSPGGI